MHVFVTGATGLIGRALCGALLQADHQVTACARSAPPKGLPQGVRVVQGDPSVQGPWQEALARCGACVHLAGEPLAAGRWTAERKQRIRESRVASTRLIAEGMGGGGPSVLISGSAVGYYGPRGDEPLDESAPPGRGFLAEVCSAWEAAALTAAARARVVLLRTGVVFAREGGAFQQRVLPFKLFVGGSVGRGAFWLPWIHLADEVALILWALETEAVAGPLNATAPHPARERELAAALGRALHRPSLLPVPPLVLRLALGEFSSVLTTGQRVIPKKALSLGFRFRFPELVPALEDLVAAH